MNCGIYKISNCIDNRVYIGSSKNLERRLTRHFSELKNGKHKNYHLQRFVDKYGLTAIDFQIIELCSEEELLQKEIKAVEYFNSLKAGFNLEYPDRSYKTNEARENMRLARINCKFNRVISIIKDNKIIDKGNISYLCNKYNLDNSSVYKILRGIRKKHKGYSFK